MAVFGMLPLGSLLIGSVSQRLGAPDTMLCQGITALVIVALFAKFLGKDRLNRREKQELEEVEENVINEV
jgi:hypothetical protein